MGQLVTFSMMILNVLVRRGLLGLLVVLVIFSNVLVPPAQAESRLFQDLKVELVDQTVLPSQTLENYKVGGLSGLTYDRQRDVYYAICDDRQAPRFFTLRIPLKADKVPQIEKIEVVAVTPLLLQDGSPFPPQQLDTEAIALSPRGTLFMSSEGVYRNQSPPFIGEFELESGKLLNSVRIPRRFLPSSEPEAPPQGSRDNLGFEPLAIAATSTLADDPFRLFVATESGLAQDIDRDNPPNNSPLRWLHYLINSVGPPVLISETLYRLDPTPAGTLSHGLSEMLTLPTEGYFFSLERTFGLTGLNAKLFQVVNADATDTSRVKSFLPGTQAIVPMRKQLLWDSATAEIEVDNLEGLSWGPNLGNGATSLLMLSDDNFNPEQETQLLLFRVTGLANIPR